MKPDRAGRIASSGLPRGARSLLSAILLLGLLAPARADDPSPLKLFEKELVDVIARTERSVVSIARVSTKADAGGERNSDQLDPFGPRRDNDPTSPAYIPADFGSGVILAREKDKSARFVLTNRHVVVGTRRGEAKVDERTRFFVRLASQRVLEARVIAADPRSDLAMLRLDFDGTEVKPDEAPPLALAEQEAKKGQMVIALGNPYAIARDGSASASLGIISNISRRPAPRTTEAFNKDENATIHEYGTLLHVDTRLSLGTSGGALVDLDGKLIGLTTSLAALEGYEKSVGFAIPMDAGMRRIIESLLDGYEVEYGFLGVAPHDARFVDLANVRGQAPQPSAAMVRWIARNSPAQAANIHPGDCILRVNDRPVFSSADLMREVGLLGPDTIATLTLLRPVTEEVSTVRLRLGKWPVYDDSQIIATARRYPPWRGLSVDYPTGRRRFMPGDQPGAWFTQSVAAVVISEVEPQGEAARAGLQAGQFITHVDGEAVTTPAEFHRRIGSGTSPVTLALSNGRRIELAAKAP
ncbi:trypsin-like peptidase domain-containing protein [Planctomyces sp. SH-PL14]|uniref:trypsin-like peptidase domain-containing protein n=1 Tax=Planctomyces sp. SH-PL14 TaxID=1632864 RepID=UPI00078B594F|nr:trypsin-like peptidase domain-containing protein [Planctomyces sp. SH-PL14]AMV19468.1 putative periplasmic serine endoprotease DegP-like precursor [Planctomyces sp. SH-PL14]